MMLAFTRQHLQTWRSSFTLIHLSNAVLVILKKEAEKITRFGGQFIKTEIAEFVFENKLPLLTNLTRESAPVVFDNPIKKQLILFAISKDSEKAYPAFLEAAKSFKGKLVFVYVELDNEEVGKPVSDYFGVTGDAPMVLAYTCNDDARKFALDGELTISNIKVLMISVKMKVEHSSKNFFECFI